MIIMCPNCAGLNRVDDNKLAQDHQSATCGKCKSPLFLGKPIEMNAEQFKRVLEKSDQPLVVDFWAPWCGPCKSFAPTFTQAAAELEPKARFIKINTEVEQMLANEFNIRSIPTLAVFKGGKEVERMSGAMNLTQLKQWLAPRV